MIRTDSLLMDINIGYVKGLFLITSKFFIYSISTKMIKLHIGTNSLSDINYKYVILLIKLVYR